MKKMLGTIAMASAMALGTIGAPAQAQWLGYGNGFLEAEETGFWESDNWGSDTFGVFDQDFAFNTDEPGWNDWYGDSATAWNEYDDVGDGGWFDV